MIVKRRTKQIAVTITLNLIVISGANAGTIGGVVHPINTLSSLEYYTNITDTVSSDAGATAVIVASGVIDNNYEDGWELTVLSTNNGKLIRTSAAGGDGVTSADEIVYTNITLAKVSGTLGAGLTDPDGDSASITSGTATWDTGDPTIVAGTTATEAYAYNLHITWGADTSLLQGTYTDTITMTLAVNTD